MNSPDARPQHRGLPDHSVLRNKILNHTEPLFTYERIIVPERISAEIEGKMVMFTASGKSKVVSGSYAHEYAIELARVRAEIQEEKVALDTSGTKSG